MEKVIKILVAELDKQASIKLYAEEHLKEYPNMNINLRHEFEEQISLATETMNEINTAISKLNLVTLKKQNI